MSKIIFYAINPVTEPDAHAANNMRNSSASVSALIDFLVTSDKIPMMNIFSRENVFNFNNHLFNTLIDKSRNKKEDLSMLLLHIVDVGYFDLSMIKKLLVDPRVNPAAEDCQILMRAVDRSHSEIVRVLLKDKRVIADVSHLVVAVKADYYHITRDILDSRDWNKNDITAVYQEAVSMNLCEMMDILSTYL